MADFFTSDHHFGHKNIIKYCNRPFDSVEEMNHGLVSLWNEVVTPEDRVFVIGDVYLCKTELARKHLKKLNGYKILIMGNHDKSKDEMNEFFDEVYQYKYEYSLSDGTPVVLAHHPWEDKDYLQIHGHEHSGNPLRGTRINVCVDLHNYRPVSLQYIEEAFSAQKNLFSKTKTTKELPMPEKINITEEQFKEFIEIQEEGSLNMLDYRGVEHFLTRAEHKHIIKNYELLSTKHEFHIL